MGQILKQAIHHNWSFWVCLVLSIILLVAAFIIPPTAIIDNSVLAAVGELLGFAALGSLMTALDKGVDARLRHGNTVLEVGDFNKKDEETE